MLEGDHALWEGVSEPYKHTIRAFLVHFHTLVLRQSIARFDWRNGSIGALPLGSGYRQRVPRTCLVAGVPLAAASCMSA
jgi:hypothetical protein